MCFTSDYLVRGTGSEGITGYFFESFVTSTSTELWEKRPWLADTSRLESSFLGLSEVLSGLEEEEALM